MNYGFPAVRHGGAAQAAGRVLGCFVRQRLRPTIEIVVEARSGRKLRKVTKDGLAFRLKRSAGRLKQVLRKT